MSEETGYCTSCRGEGVIHTGIDEAPVTECSRCDGTGELPVFAPLPAAPAPTNLLTENWSVASNAAFRPADNSRYTTTTYEDIESVGAALAARQAPTACIEWMRKVIAETRTAASLFDIGGFRAGMETACDEIETRMALDGAPLPRQAAVQGEWISVADRLPEEAETVLAGYVKEDGGDRLDFAWQASDLWSPNEPWTHWMRLTAIPQTAPDQAKSAPATTEKDA
jgi:hypothetical protein